MNQEEQQLIKWAVTCFGEQLGQVASSNPLTAGLLGRDWHNYEAVFAQSALVKKPGLAWVLSAVADPAPARTPEPTKQIVQKARPLALESLPHTAVEEPRLWSLFSEEFQVWQANGQSFETFLYLFYKYAWAVPGRWGHEGVSLYEEFKALSSVAFASQFADQPAPHLTLIGGDTSGIQEFIFTVSSKAAGKGLRGRSFFLQLLTDATVRAMLRELNLSWANAVYVAGGNFLILAPNGAKEQLADWLKEYRQTLWHELYGKLNLVIGFASIETSALAQHEEWLEVVKQLKQDQATTKQRPHAELIAADWTKVFDPQDVGGEKFCVVCQRGFKADETPIDRGGENKSEYWCDLCDSFGSLAEAIKHKTLYWEVRPWTGSQDVWARKLYELTGFCYLFHAQAPAKQAQQVVYTVNNTDFIADTDGFRFIANVTPTITAGDRTWIEAHPDKVAYEGRGVPKVGAIRDFDMLVRDAQGVSWLAVLRMDVDNLGQVFTVWQPAKNLLITSALSSGMERFFSGRLNEIVREHAIVHYEGEERLAAYIIYAGGDDLFVVGSWDKMVLLAEKIQQEFAAYTGQNPHLTISAGISLHGRAKFPLYLAAEQAHQALDEQAKAERWELSWHGHEIWREWRSKDAISFLDTAVGWSHWPQIRQIQELVIQLLQEEQNGVNRSLIQLLQSIHAAFETGRKEYEEKHSQLDKIGFYPAYHGRWQWMRAYQMGRLIRTAKGETTKAQLKKLLNEDVRNPELTPYVGLIARWAEYATRQKT